MSSQWKILACKKMVFNAKPEGRRRDGRPRLRWLNDGADIKALGVKRWRIKAQDRKEWTGMLREAKVELKGPRSQRKRRRRPTDQLSRHERQ
jgi:hypothetical protein